MVTTKAKLHDKKINLLARDILQYMRDGDNAHIVNKEKCAWELAKKVKDRRLMLDDIDSAISSYIDEPEDMAVIPSSDGNLSETMRYLYMEKNMSVAEIAKTMDKSYTRVSNVIKKMKLKRK